MEVGVQGGLVRKEKVLCYQVANSSKYKDKDNKG